MKIIPFDIVLIAGFLLFFALIGMWTIDISLSAMINEPYCGKVILTDGFWGRDPMQMYHIGLWITTISVFSFFMLVVYVVSRW